MCILKSSRCNKGFCPCIIEDRNGTTVAILRAVTRRTWPRRSTRVPALEAAVARKYSIGATYFTSPRPQARSLLSTNTPRPQSTRRPQLIGDVLKGNRWTSGLETLAFNNGVLPRESPSLSTRVWKRETALTRSQTCRCSPTQATGDLQVKNVLKNQT